MFTRQWALMMLGRSSSVSTKNVFQLGSCQHFGHESKKCWFDLLFPKCWSWCSIDIFPIAVIVPKAVLTRELIPLKPKAESSESRCYTVPELQVILNISRGSVYKLLQRKEFKWFQIGNGRYRISKKSFDQWLDGQSWFCQGCRYAKLRPSTAYRQTKIVAIVD